MTPRDTYRCSVCSFEVGEVIAELETGDLAHYSDRDFPGRCVIVVREHAEKLEELAPEFLTRLMLDVTRAGRAIRKATGAPRINYAVLGNVMPHIHVHLVPRGMPADQKGTETPWGPPPKSEPVAPEEAARLRTRIASALE
ncbi:MAG: HIT family protein [Deltaproteobacteria bacterium]|nr:HIT family protein [Deltaproteobacteria bacterium]